MKRGSTTVTNTAVALDSKSLVVTVGGKRVSRVKVLEERCAELLGQISSLNKQNAWLRARETMQMQLLSGYEDMLVRMGTFLMQTEGTNHDSSALSAAVDLDLQAQELLQQVRSPGGSACGSSSANSSDDQGPPTAELPPRRTQRLWATVTPEDVLSMQGISTAELAERFKLGMMRLALIKQCPNRAKFTDGIESAVNSLGQLLMLAMVAAGEQQLAVQCLNFETMQPEASSDAIWGLVASELQLTKEQRRKVQLAFECYSTRRASLLQQQQQLAQELKELLWPGTVVTPPSNRTMQHTSSKGSPGVLSHANNDAETATKADCADASTCSPGAGSSRPAGSDPPADTEPAHSGPAQTAATENAAEVLPESATGPSHGCSAGEESCRDSGSCGPVKGASWDSSSCSWVPGIIDLDTAMQAEAVLAKLDRNTQLQRAASRQLVLFYIDLLTTEQHANAVLAAYPYNVKVPAVLSLIAAQEAANAAK